MRETERIRQRAVSGRLIGGSLEARSHQSLYREWIQSRYTYSVVQVPSLKFNHEAWGCETTRTPKCLRLGLSAGRRRGLIASGDGDGRVFVHDSLSDLASRQLNGRTGPAASRPVWGEVKRESSAAKLPPPTLTAVWQHDVPGRSAITDTSFIPSASSLLVVATCQPVVYFLEVGRNQPLLCCRVPSGCRSLATSSSDLYAGLVNGNVCQIDPRAAAVNLICNPLSGAHTGDVTALTLRDSPDNRLCTAGRDGCVRLWDLRKPADCLQRLRVSNEALRALEISPHGNLIITRASRQHSLKVYETSPAGFFAPVPIHIIPSNSRQEAVTSPSPNGRGNTLIREDGEPPLSRRRNFSVDMRSLRSVFVNLSQFYRGAWGVWTGGDSGELLLIELNSGIICHTIQRTGGALAPSVIRHPLEGLICLGPCQDPVWFRPH